MSEAGEGGCHATAIAVFTCHLWPSLTLSFAMGKPNHCGGCGSRSPLCHHWSLLILLFAYVIMFFGIAKLNCTTKTGWKTSFYHGQTQAYFVAKGMFYHHILTCKTLIR